MEKRVKMQEKPPKPPRKGKKFKKYWYLNIENVVKRENFNDGYLKNLEILCILYVTFDEYTKEIEDNGYTYRVESRNGLQIKPYPLVGERQKLTTSIINYSKLLGLVLAPDKELAEKKEDEWM